MQQLADAYAEQESTTMALIWTELGEIYIGLAAAEDQAAAALRDACKALEGPEADLAAIDGKISAAQEKCSELRQEIARLEADDDREDAPDKAAAAKMQLAEWEARVTRLRSKRDFAEPSFRPRYDQRDDARTRLRIVGAAKHRVMLAQLNPFGDELAQATDAYISLRMPQLLPLLLRHDTGSPEWPRAVEEFTELAKRSGLRTDDLPSEGEAMAQAMTALMPDAAQAMADLAPNAADVMAQTVAEVTNKNLTPDYVDDYRTPAVPRIARDYMRVETLRDLGVR